MSRHDLELEAMKAWLTHLLELCPVCLPACAGDDPEACCNVGRLPLGILMTDYDHRWDTLRSAGILTEEAGG